jgi:L-fuconolactonase
MVIDAHHHFWNYEPKEYGWIDESMHVLRRDFLPQDLELEIKSSRIDGVVSVQARQCIAETDWLLDLANANGYIKGVVGWLPIAATDFESHLIHRIDQSKLKALRHVVQDEAPGFLDHSGFNNGIRLLKQYDLAYDLLIFEHQLKESIRFVDRHPDQRFVLDHIAKPKIQSNQLDPWQANIRELAKRANVSCKLSGLVTEADLDCWTEAQLTPYLDTVLEAFGPERLMFGSDWPVCMLATSYQEWTQLIRLMIAPLSMDEQDAIMGITASKIYNL